MKVVIAALLVAVALSTTSGMSIPQVNPSLLRFIEQLFSLFQWLEKNGGTFDGIRGDGVAAQKIVEATTSGPEMTTTGTTVTTTSPSPSASTTGTTEATTTTMTPCGMSGFECLAVGLCETRLDVKTLSCNNPSLECCDD